MTALHLSLRTPGGLVVDQDVLAIRAENLDGWFGIAPGRADLVAALPPGLLVFRDEEGEAFVAIAGGLLDLRDGECRVMAREAVMSRKLEEIADELESRIATRQKRSEKQRGVLHDLVREALRRMGAGTR